MSDHIKELDTALNVVTKIVEKYRGLTNVVVSLYLGINTEDEFIYGFNSDEFYLKVIELFSSSDCWDSKRDCPKYEVYTTEDLLVFVEQELTMNDFKTKKILNEYTFLYKNTPFDFKVVVFELTDVECCPDVNESLGTYKIKEFKLRNSLVNMYEYEIEVDDHIEVEQGVFISTVGLNSTTHSSKYIAHDLLLRFRDIVDICEKINNPKLEILSYYNEI